MDNLTELCETYILNKNEMDSYKAICDKTNKEIKSLMIQEGVKEVAVGNQTVKCVTTMRETMDEDALLQYLKDNNILTPIKKKEYIDMDSLETLIYNGVVPADVVSGMAKCKTTQKISKLLIVKNTNKEDSEDE